MTKVVPLRSTAPAKHLPASGARAKAPAKRPPPISARVADVEAYGSEIRDYCNLLINKTAAGSEARKDAIEDFRLFSETEEYQAAEELVADLMGRPATRAEVGEQIAKLIGAYPNARPADPEIFGRLLVDDVLDARPSAFELVTACRDLRRTSRFIPSIAEVLEAIKEAKKKAQAILRAHREILFVWHQSIESHEKWEEIARVAKQERLATMRQDIRRRLEGGKSLAGFPGELVEEVLAEMSLKGPSDPPA